MPRSFGNTTFEPMQEARDKELTLGPAALIGLVVALCAVCAVFFVWGYSVGHRKAPEAEASSSVPSGPSAAQLLSQSKPAPNQGGLEPHADTQASAPLESDSAPEKTAAPVTATYSPADGAQAASTQPASAQPASGNAAVVQAALPAQKQSSQPGAATGQVQSALGQGTAWMVQIAAVSHTEDADVLVSALRRRGYVVASRRDPADNLLHVQVGPFATHGDASAMRQRLLNDGYNAIIEP
jgi:DedD protein